MLGYIPNQKVCCDDLRSKQEWCPGVPLAVLRALVLTVPYQSYDWLVSSEQLSC